MDLRGELELAVAAARAGGEYLRTAQAQPQGVVSDAGRDIKLRADVASERAILQVLERSGRAVLTEESGIHGSLGEDPFWVIDPLDGTLNFSRRVPLCCVSVALWRGDGPLLGAIYDFNHDELFAAAVGVGAWCNERPVSVSAVSSAAQAVLATGFPVHRDFDAPALAAFVEQIRTFKKVRLLGSAALSLAYVACGRVDAYAEDDIMLWDVAAGLALVEAAGGHVQSTKSSRVQWALNVRGAASPRLWPEGAR